MSECRGDWNRSQGPGRKLGGGSILRPPFPALHQTPLRPDPASREGDAEWRWITSPGKTHCVDTVLDHEVSPALELYVLIRTGNLGEFCFCLLLENGQTQVRCFSMWFTKAAGGNDCPDSVSQFALEIPHSWAALDLFPGEHQKTATFVFAEIKPSLFFCFSEGVCKKILSL